MWLVDDISNCGMKLKIAVYCLFPVTRRLRFNHDYPLLHIHSYIHTSLHEMQALNVVSMTAATYVPSSSSSPPPPSFDTSSQRRHTFFLTSDCRFVLSLHTDPLVFGAPASSPTPGISYSSSPRHGHDRPSPNPHKIVTRCSQLCCSRWHNWDGHASLAKLCIPLCAGSRRFSLFG